MYGLAAIQQANGWAMAVAGRFARSAEDRNATLVHERSHPGIRGMP